MYFIQNVLMVLGATFMLVGCSYTQSEMTPEQMLAMKKWYQAEPVPVFKHLVESSIVTNEVESQKLLEAKKMKNEIFAGITETFQKAGQICAKEGGVVVLFRDTTKSATEDHVHVTCGSGKSAFFKKKR
jgi:hypothetical protein